MRNTVARIPFDVNECRRERGVVGQKNNLKNNLKKTKPTPSPFKRTEPEFCQKRFRSRAFSSSVHRFTRARNQSQKRFRFRHGPGRFRLRRVRNHVDDFRLGRFVLPFHRRKTENHTGTFSVFLDECVRSFLNN